jgi:hypothetical protein
MRVLMITTVKNFFACFWFLISLRLCFLDFAI